MLKIDIYAKNIELDNPLRVFVNEKIGNLDRILGQGEYVAKVEIGKPSKHHKSGPVFYAEASIEVGRKVFRANAQHYDLRAAITEVKEELHIQIKKFKEKRKDLTRIGKIKENTENI